jgi:hypothetical protein
MPARNVAVITETVAPIATSLVARIRFLLDHGTVRVTEAFFVAVLARG